MKFTVVNQTKHLLNIFFKSNFQWLTNHDPSRSFLALKKSLKVSFMFAGKNGGQIEKESEDK